MTVCELACGAMAALSKANASVNSIMGWIGVMLLVFGRALGRSLEGAWRRLVNATRTGSSIEWNAGRRCLVPLCDVVFNQLDLIWKDTPCLLRVDQQHGKNDQGLNDSSKYEDLSGSVIAAQETC